MASKEWADYMLQYPIDMVRAKVPGVAVQTIYAWQNGRRVPSVWAQGLLRKALGPPPELDELGYVIEPGKAAVKRETRGRKRRPVGGAAGWEG